MAIHRIGKPIVKHQPIVLWAVLVAALAWLLGAPPVLAIDDRPDSEMCLECHESFDTTLAHTPHRLTDTGSRKYEIQVSCVDCHTGWDVHLEEPDAATIGNPAHASVEESVVICAACHGNPHQLSMAEHNPHTMAGLNCSSCHTIHNPGKTPLRGSSTERCLDCHTSTRAEFELTSNHRVLEGVVTCVDCHQLTQQLSVPFSDGLTRRCLACHNEIEGPYPYEHQATNAYSVEGGGCLECHHPHGSLFDRLLREPTTPLCMQCHTVPTHQIAHGGVFAGEECTSCHADIHGSFDNAQYFPPGAPPATCFQSGCHPLGGYNE